MKILPLVLVLCLTVCLIYGRTIPDNEEVLLQQLLRYYEELRETSKDTSSPPIFDKKRDIGPPQFRKRENENVNTIIRRHYERSTDGDGLKSNFIQLDDAANPPRFGKRENKNANTIIRRHYEMSTDGNELKSNIIQLGKNKDAGIPPRFGRRKDSRNDYSQRFGKGNANTFTTRNFIPPRIGKRGRQRRDLPKTFFI